METINTFDALVAGAGLSGLTAAYVMAKSGMKVAVVERGAHPGAKNVMGGVLYCQPTEQVFPEFAREAPLERCIVQQNLWVLSETGALQTGVKNQAWNKQYPNGFTVLRAKFDKWLSQKVIEAGALIIPETNVTDVIMENNTVIGLRTDRENGDLYAKMVIASDGVHSLVARKAGLKEEWKNNQLSLTVKEIIVLSRKQIEDRFHLTQDEGATIECVGDATNGLMGVAFIYTNKDTLSVGAGTLLSEMIRARKNPNDLLEHFKTHPCIAPLLEGGKTHEYLAHLIPEGGYHAVPKVYKAGLLLTGDAAGLVNSFHREGSNLAIMSGKIAAETALEACQRGDFSETFLSLYKKKLDESCIMKDLKKYANAGSFFEKRNHFFTLYPNTAVQSATEWLTVDSVPKRLKQWKIIRSLVRIRPFFGLLSDGIGALRKML
ncbi:MAG: FAD-dependent oxidoreductase [Candidatus Aureabacteria bacterium]|nr:FAD-dependent oxidoreductase [Candidatus Auribacterota bacterium]